MKIVLNILNKNKMAPKKKTSYLHLELELEEESKLRQMLETKDIRGKQLLRTLVRKWMRGEIK